MKYPYKIRHIADQIIGYAKLLCEDDEKVAERGLNSAIHCVKLDVTQLLMAEMEKHK